MVCDTTLTTPFCTTSVALINWRGTGRDDDARLFSERCCRQVISMLRGFPDIMVRTGNMHVFSYRAWPVRLVHPLLPEVPLCALVGEGVPARTKVALRRQGVLRPVLARLCMLAIRFASAHNENYVRLPGSCLTEIPSRGL